MPPRVPVGFFGTALSAAIFAAIVLFVWPARADLQLDGRWQQSPLREDYTVQQWLPNGCGPTPQTGSTGGGEIVAIRLEGDELAFVGGGRVYRSNQCYDQMPTLTRETHSRDANGKTWRTRCTTPPNDPRKAILNTLVVAQTDTHIDMIETGRYEIVLETGRCVADVKRTRTYNLVAADKPAVSAAPAPAPAPEPTPKPEPKPAVCESPGEPTRLEVRPSKKLLRTGETFPFRGLVLDDKGCATRTPMTWKIQAGTPSGVTVDSKGLVTIGSGAPEGTVELVVAAAGKETRVSVEVTSPAHYDDLLASSGLNASGETDAAAVVTIASSSLGAGAGTVEDRSKSRRWVFVGIIGGVLVVLGVLALVLRGRSRRAAAIVRAATERHETEVAEVLERRRIREEQHALQKRAHEESVAAAAAARAKPRVQPASPAPQVGAGGSPIAAPGAAALPTKRGKICPTCGDRFDGAADFCGKDGTQLVLLN